jgi:hypothetical protein
MKHTLAIVLGITAAALGQGQAPQPLWQITFGAADSTDAKGLSPDGAGGVFVVGNTFTNLYGPSAGLNDAFIGRYDASGNLIWGRQFGSASLDGAGGVCSDGAGGAFVSGSTYWDMVPGIYFGEHDAFLARYDQDGNQLWLRQFGTAESESASFVCPDGAGGVYAAGMTRGDMGGPNAGYRDCFLARYNADGEQMWLRQFGTEWDDWCEGLVADGAGGVYIGGDTPGNLGSPNLGGLDGWLARFDASGQMTWIRQMGTPASDSLQPEIADDKGFWAIGWSLGSFFGPAIGSHDVVIGRFNASGELLWGRQFGSIAPDSAESAASDGAGGVYLCGLTFGALAGPAPGVGQTHSYLVRYDGSGNQLWARQWNNAPAYPGNGTVETWARAAAPDDRGGVYVGGTIWDGSNSTRRAFLMRFPGPCYPNCDNSTAQPILNVLDFVCFLQKFAAGDPYANCDQSTNPPLLNIADFACFLQKFTEACP